ncbi:hypothetical protein F511_16073 [Dorcoceras hygrometricum]|uniref:Uncharacterized protein n=1 Tax=Dorcoceras hygrometricum TaxID=472368 RepID=A0A2Z7BT57_9LAMI|nr:hypothetical protein F511_16073 [Dorcoceras hygrometricum]
MDIFAYVEPSVDRYAYVEQMYLLLVVSRNEKLEKMDSAVEVFSNDDGAVTRNYDVSNISRQLSGISDNDISSDVITISHWIRRCAKEKLLTDEKNKGEVELLSATQAKVIQSQALQDQRLVYQLQAQTFKWFRYHQLDNHTQAHYITRCGFEEPVVGATRRRLVKLNAAFRGLRQGYLAPCDWIVATGLLRLGCCDWFVVGSMSASRKIPTVHDDWIALVWKREAAGVRSFLRKVCTFQHSRKSLLRELNQEKSGFLAVCCRDFVENLLGKLKKKGNTGNQAGQSGSSAGRSPHS